MSIDKITQPIKDFIGLETYLHIREAALKILNNLAWVADSGNRLYWPLLISFVLIGFFAYSQNKEKNGFLSFLLPKRVFLHPDSIRGYAFVAINSVLSAIIRFGSLIISTLMVIGWTEQGLTALFGSPDASVEAGVVAILTFTIVIMVAGDFGLWTSHALFHKVPVFWEFHKVHHCPAQLTPVTDRQIHPVEEIIRGAILALALGPVIGTAQYLYGTPPTELTVLGIGVFKLLFELFGNFRHSHIWIAFPRWLSHIISSPAMHQIHHSSAKEHWDINYAVMFSFWDWMFGTLYIPRERETLSLGVYGDSPDELNSVVKLYFRPFVRAASHIPGFRGHKEIVAKRRLMHAEKPSSSTSHPS